MVSISYSVGIILDSIKVDAGSVEEANEIATEIHEGNAREHLDYGLTIIDYETEQLE